MGALGTGSTGSVGSGSGTAMADLEPVVIPAMDPAARFVAVDGGVQFTCALDDLGSVWCWGRNEASQLGLDSDAIWVHPDSIVAPVDLGATAESISVGPYHSCAVLTGGSVRCWGFDRSGSLGVGLPGQQVGSTAQPVSSVDPVDLGSGRVAIGVSAGGQHTCVLLDDASMLCWGENDFGQLGAGDVVDRGRTLDSMGDALVLVDLPGGVVSMAAGGEHTCAVLDDASLHCWGLNDFGQLGLGDITNRGGALREVGSITEVDFGVIQGVRTVEEQEALVAKGASKTMKSYHLPQEDGYGHAVDLMAYIAGRGSWELNVYDEIADAMKQAAQELEVPIRWGAAWNVPDIRDWDGTMEEAMNHYIDTRRAEGRRPFIDAPHFELMI